MKGPPFFLILIVTLFRQHNFRQKPSTNYMESSHNAPIIHAFDLAQKRFFQPVNSQKPRTKFLHRVYILASQNPPYEILPCFCAFFAVI